MKESDLKNILIGIDAALEAYRKNEGKLSAVEISLKSMLDTVRDQVRGELNKENAEAQTSLTLEGVDGKF